MNVIAELYGGPKDGATAAFENVPEPPAQLVFAAAWAPLACWDVVRVDSTTYLRAETISAGDPVDIIRYRYQP